MEEWSPETQAQATWQVPGAGEGPGEWIRQLAPCLCTCPLAGAGAYSCGGTRPHLSLSLSLAQSSLLPPSALRPWALSSCWAPNEGSRQEF